MKFSTFLALTGAVSASKNSEIVTGLLKGALDLENVDDTKQCIADAKQVVSDVEITYNDFKSKKYAAGVKELSAAYKEIQVALKDCKKTKVDFSKLEKISQALAEPTSLSYTVGKELSVNGADIFADMEDAVKQYQAKNWEQFGYDLGTASAKALLGSEISTLDKKTQVAEIFQGITTAFGGDFDLMALLICIQEEDKALLMFDAAIHSFITAWKNKEWGDAIGGVIVTLAAIQQFQQGLPACEAITADKWQQAQFEQSLDIIEHPMQYFTIVEDDVKINGKSIVADGVAATEAYLQKDFVKFGEKMGAILKLATQKPEEQLELVTSEDAKEAADALQGFLTATNVGHFNFTALLACIYEMDQAAIEFVAAFNILKSAIHDKKIMEGVAGSLFAFSAFQ
mmetsp:Transcript_29462/g.44666  ORF Transcript_29462/g.44666 Transcript_29462/m.44666 type:complete len:399 (-) Transcript_29462:404-1600(-)